jgi:hypothetical protein
MTTWFWIGLLSLAAAVTLLIGFSIRWWRQRRKKERPLTVAEQFAWHEIVANFDNEETR